MTTIIDAVYEAGVFRPLKPIVELPEGEQVRLTVDAEAKPFFNRTEMTEEEIQTRLEIIQQIAALAVPQGRMETASRDHDQFLYGPEGAR